MAVHVVCCGGLLLFATGLLSFGTVVTWLGSGAARAAGIAILAVAALAVLLWLVRRRGTRIPGAGGGARTHEPDAGHPNRSF